MVREKGDVGEVINGSQGKGKTTNIILHKSSRKTNDQGQSGGMAIT